MSVFQLSRDHKVFDEGNAVTKHLVLCSRANKTWFGTAQGLTAAPLLWNCANKSGNSRKAETARG
jgi:hypothetical protein